MDKAYSVPRGLDSLPLLRFYSAETEAAEAAGQPVRMEAGVNLAEGTIHFLVVESERRLTVAEVATVLGTSVTHVRRLMRAGALEYMDLSVGTTGSALRISASAVRALEERRTRRGDAAQATEGPPDASPVAPPPTASQRRLLEKRARDVAEFKAFLQRRAGRAGAGTAPRDDAKP